MSETLILLINLTATLFMTGVIWFVQVVHYPLFGKVGTSEYCDYASAHSQKTTWIVGPPMLVELATSGLLAAHPPTGVTAWQTWTGLALVGILWFSTMFLQVPQHNVLGGGFDREAHRRLVATNWLRTLCWSLRSLLVLWMVSSRLN